jgi:GNAT superfamily N-acetyltransferase
VTRALVPLSMTTIGMLPERCRSCVAWEMESSAARAAVRLGDTEFEKEVWLSGVMLTWGSAGQIVTVDDNPVGFALYAPPTAVPGASAFPTSPVSPDAVLLTSARIRDSHTGQGLARYLLEGVFAELSRRGVRAIELFGREGTPDAEGERAAGGKRHRKLRAERSAERSDSDLAGPAAAAPAAGGSAGGSADDTAGTADSSVPQCLLPAAFARAVGFEEVAPHHHYPRLRYELAQGLRWKADVEAALEKLFTVITVPASPSPAAPDRVGAR